MIDTIETRWEPDRVQIQVTCARYQFGVKTGERSTEVITLFREIDHETGTVRLWGETLADALQEAATLCEKAG